MTIKGYESLPCISRRQARHVAFSSSKERTVLTRIEGGERRHRPVSKCSTFSLDNNNEDNDNDDDYDDDDESLK